MNPCVYCANRNREPCSACEEEGKFRHLAPKVLRNWEIPDLPPYYKLMETDACAVRAMFYLVLHHLQKKVY